MKYHRVRAGLEARQKAFANQVNKDKDNGRALKKPGSLNGKKTGSPVSSTSYSRGIGKKRSRAAAKN